MRMPSSRQGLGEGRGFSFWDIIEKVQPFRFSPTLSELASGCQVLSAGLLVDNVFGETHATIIEIGATPRLDLGG
jgi:hypothetical protein